MVVFQLVGAENWSNRVIIL